MKIIINIIIIMGTPYLGIDAGVAYQSDDSVGVGCLSLWIPIYLRHSSFFCRAPNFLQEPEQAGA